MSSSVSPEPLPQEGLPACQYAARWHSHQLTSHRRANYPAWRIQLITKPIMINQTDLHGIRPPPAPGQRKMNLCERTRIAVWNVQTLLRPGHAALLSRELSRYNIALAGLCETRWRGTGETSAGDHFFIWSGPDNNSGLYGVALVIPLRIKRTLISRTPINDRLLTARLLHQHGKITVVVAYSPTEVAEDQTKDTLYDQAKSRP